jgi:nucleoside-diphosphate kinase
MVLKRTPTPTVKLEDLYIGAIVNMYLEFSSYDVASSFRFSRQLHVTDFGDPYTKSRLEGQREETLALIKMDAFDSIFSSSFYRISNTISTTESHGNTPDMGKIIDTIYREGFRVFKVKMFKLSDRDLEDFAAISKKSKKEFTEWFVALVLQTEGCVKKWRELMGPASPAEARKTTIDSLRSVYGKDNTRNAVYGSNTAMEANDVSSRDRKRLYWRL